MVEEGDVEGKMKVRGEDESMGYESSQTGC